YHNINLYFWLKVIDAYLIFRIIVTEHNNRTYFTIIETEINVVYRMGQQMCNFLIHIRHPAVAKSILGKLFEEYEESLAAIWWKIISAFSMKEQCIQPRKLALCVASLLQLPVAPVDLIAIQAEHSFSSEDGGVDKIKKKCCDALLVGKPTYQGIKPITDDLWLALDVARMHLLATIELSGFKQAKDLDVVVEKLPTSANIIKWLEGKKSVSGPTRFLRDFDDSVFAAMSCNAEHRIALSFNEPDRAGYDDINEIVRHAMDHLISTKELMDRIRLYSYVFSQCGYSSIPIDPVASYGFRSTSFSSPPYCRDYFRDLHSGMPARLRENFPLREPDVFGRVPLGEFGAAVYAAIKTPRSGLHQSSGISTVNITLSHLTTPEYGHDVLRKNKRDILLEAKPSFLNFAFYEELKSSLSKPIIPTYHEKILTSKLEDIKGMKAYLRYVYYLNS
ncbi:MAG: hypothetical protein K2X37_14325, partial [Chitinophagaceae bacterium]|nr:hypothetical protein [Chitinophagaceae bacterium]